MPTPVETPHFNYRKPFPWCPSDTDLSVFNMDYVDNLSLAQVEGFFWDTADIEFTFAGSTSFTTTGGVTYTAHATGSIKFRQPMMSGDFENLTVASVWPYSGAAPFHEGMLRSAGDGESELLVEDLPETTTEPRERVCDNGAQRLLYCFLTGDLVTGGHNSYPRFADFLFTIGVDPANEGRYRIWYRFLVISGAGYYTTNLPSDIAWTNPYWGTTEPPTESANILNSGTFTIGDIEFDYVCYDNNHGSGGTMSAERTVFTYV